MLVIILLGVLLIGIYRFGEKHNLNAKPWLIAVILAYCAGYFGFQFLALNKFPSLYDNEWERLGYPALSAFVCVLFVLVAMLFSGKRIKKRIEDEEIMDDTAFDD
jgi:uncharacterized membrane protein YfcA